MKNYETAVAVEQDGELGVARIEVYTADRRVQVVRVPRTPGEEYNDWVSRVCALAESDYGPRTAGKVHPAGPGPL